MQGWRPRQRLGDWRRFGAHAAILGLLLESLVGIAHAGLSGSRAPAIDGEASVYIEICTPTGIQRIAWDGVPPAEAPEEPSEPQTSGYPCLLCAALGALAPDRLLVEVGVDWPDNKPAFRPQAEATPLSAPARRPQQSRAPPLSH